MKQKMIGIIGRIDTKETLFDGQTVKTRTIYKELISRFDKDRIVAVDTTDYRKHFIRVIIQLIKCIVRCDDIIVLLSQGGRKALFPILYASSYANKRIYHNLIGGRLAWDIDHDASGQLVKQLNSFRVNWVESHSLVDALSARGVNNVRYLPNFKNIEPLAKIEDYSKKNPMRFCMFSRVVPKKGIKNAVESIAKINKNAGNTVALLDIYGPVDQTYSVEFQELIKKNINTTYRGCVNPEHSVSTIRGYDALLFPTEWYFEGIPGTIIDALCAGVPVIASHWAYYDEMLQDEATGFSYQFDEPSSLLTSIEKFMNCSIERIIRMKNECISRASLYTPEEAFNQIMEAIEE